MSLKRSGIRNWKALCIAPCVFLILIVFIAPVEFTSARNDWQKDDTSNRDSLVKKPVDPVFINFVTDEDGPVYQSAGSEEGSIDIPIGESWRLDYYLEEGKKYHIFLVGDWICNDTEPQTDYDIKTTYPDGTSLWNTESAGLPEQVANDDEHQYFVPPLTGTYYFEIVNDERDSKDWEPAIFMLIEHIDVNTVYSQELEGRDSDGNEVLFSGWAYEINTLAPKIRVFVDVPDSLDMYEVRLYMMANPDAEVGYNISELGVPYGGLFEAFSGEYGGFSTSCKGDRNIEAMDSCEHSGRNMEFVYDTPNAEEDAGNIFYYLVLIAEHEEGTVEFYAQTDFDPPIITLDDPPETGCEGKKTKINALVEDDCDLERVWVEYTVNDGPSVQRDSKQEEDMWVCSLPPFEGGDLVKYTLYAEDKFGNSQSVKSDFLVKKENTIACTVNDVYIVGNEDVKITGSSTLSSASLKLKFTNGDASKDFDIMTDEEGSFEFEFSPDKLGDWNFQAFYDGSGTEFTAESNIVFFTMKSKLTHVSSILSASKVKMNVPVTVSGSVSPSEARLPVEVMFVSSSSSHTETVSTAADGSYSCTFQPTEAGTWSVLSKVGDGLRYASSQSQIVEFAAVPLNIFDKITVAALMLVTPPYLYGTGGVIGLVATAIVYMKREALAPYLPKSAAKKSGNSKARGKNKNKKGGQRYRRVKK
jgi:hypothetical protein